MMITIAVSAVSPSKDDPRETRTQLANPEIAVCLRYASNHAEESLEVARAQASPPDSCTVECTFYGASTESVTAYDDESCVIDDRQGQCKSGSCVEK